MQHFEASRGWDDEEIQILDQIRRVAAEVIAPRAAENDEAKSFPWASLRSLHELGLSGISIPEAYGGSPVSYRLFLEAVLIVSQACAATGIIFGTNSACVKPILQYGSEAQKRRFLPRMLEGGLAALAITEPHAGSDATQMRTSFRRDGDDVVVNGSKIFITTGDVADLVILFGKWSGIETPAKAVSALVVEKGTPGFEVLRLERKMGTHASSTAALGFSDCRVPLDNLLGAPGDGFKILLSTLNKSRPSVAAQALGIATAAFEDARAYACERHQGGRRVLDYQANQFLMADLATELLTTRMLLDHVGRLVDAGIEDIAVEASMVKVRASDLAMRMTVEAVQLHGGHGYCSDHRVERLMREAKITQIWEGTNQIQRQVIGRDLLLP
ncbi:acyl-CoA dehydrogenase family protein [Methylobacterium frigidaeris]|nr:acyl-CoA dehydrogenase family protein [Methylobacterium frigidaeris]